MIDTSSSKVSSQVEEIKAEEAKVEPVL